MGRMDPNRRPGIGPLRRSIRHGKQLMPPLNFITIHWAYFIITCLVSAIIIWGSSTPPKSVRFIDALFLAVSAMTETGLNTIDLSTLNTFQQFILFFLIMIGSAIFVSAFVVQVRRAAFGRKFQILAEQERKKGEPLTSQFDVNSSSTNEGIVNVQGVGVLAEASLKTSTKQLDGTHQHANGHDHGRSSGAWISRNSQFHGLTAKERERLGGYEYRAVCLLAWLVPAYYVLWQLLGALGCAAWVAYNRPDSARTNGLNPWWVGAFNAISAFNNSGMSLLDANMTAYQTGYYLLITMGLLILAGNTCYPIFLRLIVWSLWKVSSWFEGEQWTERTSTLRFLLDHPRRCYTNLFPSLHTRWLLGAVVVLNTIDWAGFEILNIGNEPIEALPVNVRVIDGLFQAFAVRSGGFYVVNISTLRIGLQVLYVVMMYISVYPVVISMRNTNVYEERSLGIYDDSNETMALDDEAFRTHAPGWNAGGGSPRKQLDGRFVQQQLRAQLAHDLWILFMALFLIMIVESSQFQRDPAVFSVFNFLFDIVSAYGCVGLSTGVPWATYSFCGTWHTLSKLILCFVMLRGRHRGLPIAIDKAILLPGEDLAEAEEDDGRIREAQNTSDRHKRGES